MTNIETVKDIYEAFGRGDIPAIVDKLDVNVEWDVEDPMPGVPWLQPRRGAVNVPARGGYGETPADGERRIR